MVIALAIISAVSLGTAICAVLFSRTVVAAAARDRAGDRATIDMLCQRIQAPETAVASFVAENAPPDPAPVDLEDDDAMAEARKAREEQAWQR